MIKSSPLLPPSITPTQSLYTYCVLFSIDIVSTSDDEIFDLIIPFFSLWLNQQIKNKGRKKKRREKRVLARVKIQLNTQPFASKRKHCEMTEFYDVYELIFSNSFKMKYFSLFRRLVKRWNFPIEMIFIFGIRLFVISK